MQEIEKLTQELIGFEKKYWQAMADHDLDTAIGLTDFPCLVAGAHGVRSVDQKQYEQIFHSHQESIKDFAFTDEPKVRLLNPETAILAYEIRGTVEADGKEKSFDAVDASTWIKRGDRWVCALHMEAEVQ